MTKYQFIDQQKDLIVKLINNGLITFSIMRDVNIYEHFLALTGKKKERYKTLEKIYGLNHFTIRNLITNLNQKMKQ